MNGNDIDMRMFAQRAGANVTFSAGSVVFNKGDPGSCMYIVQPGVIEMVIGNKVIEICGQNEAIGFMSMIDGAPRSSTARVKEACELSLIDQRKFRFMVDEVPNFALYILGAMARRIRGIVRRCENRRRGDGGQPSPGRRRAPAMCAMRRTPGKGRACSVGGCAEGCRSRSRRRCRTRVRSSGTRR